MNKKVSITIFFFCDDVIMFKMFVIITWSVRVNKEEFQLDTTEQLRLLLTTKRTFQTHRNSKIFIIY